MKQYLFTFLLILNICKPVISASPDTVLLFHPTVNNIKTIHFLIENKILDLDPAAYHFLGVAHASGSYDYKESHQFLEENPDLPFSLQIVKNTIPEDAIFQENEWSDTFITLFDHSVAAIFLGGPDLPPALYGENMNLLTIVTDPMRHYLEISAIFHFLGSDRNSSHPAYLSERENYAVLGICLGMQSLNVGTGGSLVQDIPSELYSITDHESLIARPDIEHRNYSFNHVTDNIELTSYHFHRISFNIEKELYRKLHLKKNANPEVLSSHHQGIESTGSNIVPLAWSMDGKIIEMIGHEKFPAVLGVQFHPENTGLYNPDLYFYTDRNTRINFNQSVLGSDSYDFHISLWSYISELIRNSR